MKKMNMLMSAAVAGLFAVSAQAAEAPKAAPAGEAKKMEAKPTTEKDCAEHKMTWKEGKCECKTGSCKK